MCLIPKCASRRQATFLGTSEGFGEQAIKHAYEIAEKHLSPRTAKSIKDVAMRINEYTKIVIVREPFSRLLSAYRDKIENGGNGLNYKKKYDTNFLKNEGNKAYNHIKKKLNRDSLFSNFENILKEV